MNISKRSVFGCQAGCCILAPEQFLRVPQIQIGSFETQKHRTFAWPRKESIRSIFIGTATVAEADQVRQIIKIMFHMDYNCIIKNCAHMAFKFLDLLFAVRSSCVASCVCMVDWLSPKRRSLHHTWTTCSSSFSALCFCMVCANPSDLYKSPPNFGCYIMNTFVKWSTCRNHLIAKKNIIAVQYEPFLNVFASFGTSTSRY